MKKILVFSTFLALCITSTTISCTKEKIIETPALKIKHTDSPAPELFQNVPVGTVQFYWLDSIALRSTTVKQNGCQYWYDQYNNTNDYGNCGDYRRIQAYVYWGTMNGVVQLSVGKSYVWISQEAYSNAVNKVFNHIETIGELCRQCTFTNSVDGAILWIKN